MNRIGVRLFSIAHNGKTSLSVRSIFEFLIPNFVLDIRAFSSASSDGKRPLYMDIQATTPLVSITGVKYCFIPQDPRALDAMMPYLTTAYGNPHSRTHMYGWESEKAVEVARSVSLTN